MTRVGNIEERMALETVQDDVVAATNVVMYAWALVEEKKLQAE